MEKTNANVNTLPQNLITEAIYTILYPVYIEKADDVISDPADEIIRRPYKKRNSSS
jgi:hypothetical protein